MLGLGGGVLAAQLARVNISTVAIELSVSVIGTYRTTFQPLTAKWAPAVYDLVRVRYGDAFSIGTARGKHIPVKKRIVVVDLPQCYKAASSACAALIRRLAVRAQRVIVHVWLSQKDGFLSKVRNVSGTIVAAGHGSFVWATSRTRAKG